jgi:mono/diheme cytochrome c family protein
MAMPLTRIGLAALLALVPLAAFAQDKAPAGDAAAGKRIFTRDVCYSCHGYDGQGSRVTGPRLARTQLPYEAFTQQLREPAAEMPAYSAKVLPDRDAADIYAYLKSLPVPPEVKDLAILRN